MSEQIRISEQHWKYLNSMKEPGESFDDVVGRLITQHDYGTMDVGDTVHD